MGDFSPCEGVGPIAPWRAKVATLPKHAGPVFSLAPMMDATDRHFRYLFRQVSRRALLYTEMITTGAIVHGDRERLLGLDTCEHPIAIQLGGDNPSELAACARIAADWGYDEVNLNVGCPSDRVQSGHFGACLMARPQVVAAGIAAMRDAVDIEITVKHRIGIDDLDRYEDMLRFVDSVGQAGCGRFSIHARKAWLHGLSPRENRSVPPLRYADVYRLKQERPELCVEINGGIETLEDCEMHLQKVDAVMVGRATYDDPCRWLDTDRRLFGETADPARREDVARAMAEYVDDWVSRGGQARHVLRHCMHLFAGQPGARRFRRHLSEHGWIEGANGDVLRTGLELVQAPRPT